MSVLSNYCKTQRGFTNKHMEGIKAVCSSPLFSVVKVDAAVTYSIFWFSLIPVSVRSNPFTRGLPDKITFIGVIIQRYEVRVKAYSRFCKKCKGVTKYLSTFFGIKSKCNLASLKIALNIKIRIKRKQITIMVEMLTSQNFLSSIF